jgi:hypothetical protein
MGVESVILLLIQICVVVGLCYLVIWVLGKLGLELPPRVVSIFWVIVVLIIILLLWRTLGGAILGGKIP